MKIIFAGKYCKNLSKEKFNKHDCIYLGEFEDYSPHINLADLVISYGYGKIFKEDALKKKILNLHPSILPYGRGIYPIVWSVYNKHPIGYTIYQIISNRIDEGRLYSSQEIKYKKNETFLELFKKITKKAENDLINNYESYFNNESKNIVTDKGNLFYKSKKESKEIVKYLSDGWDTTIEKFLLNTKNVRL